MIHTKQGGGTLSPTALYETSFHLPATCRAEDLESFLTRHSHQMPGLLQTGPMIRAGVSPIEDHVHYTVQYLFESKEAVQHYLTPNVSSPVRQAFSDEYGPVVKERKRYLNGEEMF